MRFGFILYKYFPFGGLQRDLMRIAQECHRRGHDVIVYTMDWQGPRPEWMHVRVLPVVRLTNHRRYGAFHRRVQARIKDDALDVLVGLNKMPGLDVYYAADPCYLDRPRRRFQSLRRLLPRHRHFVDFERAVFCPGGCVRILLIVTTQIESFKRHYGTRDARFRLLPPGISPERRPPADAAAQRAAFRQEYGLRDDEHLVLMVGSGFRTKGVDRAIQAMASLPETLRNRTRMMVIGSDNPSPFEHQARQQGVGSRVTLMKGRDDIQRFYLGADLLIHPAYYENAGMVLLEAAIVGLPVLTTANCGYAPHILEADCGTVLPEPFEQPALNAALAEMLISSRREQWAANGIEYGRTQDLYSMPERAVDELEVVATQRL